MRLKPPLFLPIPILALLLGTLPTFQISAIPLNDFVGTIEFLDADGVTPISYVSLNGPAADVGVQLRITDKDLDVIIKREGDNADVLDANRLSSGNVLPLEGEEWFDLQDMNGDGRVDIRDIRALDDEGNSVVTTSERIWYDGTNGILRVPVTATKLEYWIKTKTTLGPASTSRQTGMDRLGRAVYESLTHSTTIPVPEGHSLLPQSYSWIDVLEARFPGLKQRQDIVAVVPMLVANLRSYNETPATDNEPDLTVGASFTPADSQTQASISFTIFDTGPIGEPGDPEFIPGAEVGVGPGGQRSNVVVEYEYWGSSDSAYPDRTSSQKNGDKPVGGLVTLISDAAPAGVTPILEETHAASGVFVATILICQADSEECTATGGETPTIPVNKEGDTILVTYEDASPKSTHSAPLPLDVNGPTLAQFSPASGSAGRENEPIVAFRAIDVESGLVDSDDALDSIYVVAGLYDLETEKAADSVVFERDDLRLAETTYGYTVSVTIHEGREDKHELNNLLLVNDSQYEIRWWAVSTDNAGNISISDSDNETKCAAQNFNLDGFKFLDPRTESQAADLIAVLEDSLRYEAGCDPHAIRVDTASPSLKGAATGPWLDDDVHREGPEAIRTSIVAVFNEDLDCATVSADDFRVDGSAPKSLTCNGPNVYLEVAELSSDATPNIEVPQGSVADRAGNPVAAGSVTAEDGIPAKLILTPLSSVGDGPRPVTRRAVTLTIASDEALSGNPVVTINKVGDDHTLVRFSQGEAFPSGAVNQWTLPAGLSRDGLYNVRISAVDRGGRIEASFGLDETDLSADSLKDSNAILFEVDSKLNPPTFWPKNNSETDNPNAFIRIDFSRESREYGLTELVDNESPPPAKTRIATDNPALVDISFDTHKTVEIVSAIFDGKDVTDEVVTRDEVAFIFYPRNLSLGDHRLELEARDAAGNWWTDSLNFTVIEPQPFKLPINPGLNLISLPADPQNPGIDAVFGSETEIASVITYDNATGLWLTAIRGEDGSLIGDLDFVDSDHGYWVVSEEALTLEIMLVRRDELTVFPPAINLVEGWNLVPVKDTARRPFGTALKAADYFSNIEGNIAHGYDSQTGSLKRLNFSQDSGDEIAIGSAYWVYANEDGVIVP